MPDHSSFSALDRHAVLAGSDNGFPWYACAMLADEAGELVRLPADKAPARKVMFMFAAKIVAALETAANWLGATGYGKRLSAG